MPERYRAVIKEKKEYGSLVELCLELEAHLEAEPGQFIHVRCEKEGLILRRPYSLSGVNGNSASILVREVGTGSSWLCESEKGRSLDIMGPLGRGFDIGGRGRQGLVAGGTGIAPLLFLAERLRGMDMEVSLFWGIESEGEYLGFAEGLRRDIEFHLATIDGSAGTGGSVVDALKGGGIENLERIYACGPRGMLAALAESIDETILAEMQVCMEERMACGIGACRGCVVPAALPPGTYLTVCKDGPVFRGRELDWKRMTV